MPGTSELGSSNVGETQSLGNIIEEPSKHGSFDSNHPPDPNRSRGVSPPGRLTRKRAATLSTGRSNLSQDIGDLAINSTSTTAPLPSELTRDQVCLCQPDPKIPRPRNGMKMPLSLSYLHPWIALAVFPFIEFDVLDAD